MEITPLIQKAITKIGELHRDQPRKVENFPYVAHPYVVAILLSRYTDNENIVVAGLLHDVLEDVAITTYGPEEMKRDFGDNIYRIVEEVSALEMSHRRPAESLPWLERKQIYLQKLTNASPEAMIVSAADKIHFMQSIVTGYRRHGEALWAKLGTATPKQRLWFCQSVVNILQSRLDNPIADKLSATFKQAQSILSVDQDIKVLPV